jgi:hypothetical protein
MQPVQRFGEYAATFEKVFTTDDWSLLEPFFTEDAVYDVKPDGPLGGRHEGREAVFAALKQSLDSFDRRFDARELELLEGPELRDGAVWMRWRVTYRLDGAPELALEGEETAHFDDGRIRLLADRFDDGVTERTQAWLAEHGARLGTAA